MAFNSINDIKAHHRSDLEAINSVDSALEHLLEIKSRTQEIVQVVSITKSNSHVNFHRGGQERLTKTKVLLQKNEELFQQLHSVYKDCVQREAGLDDSKEPKLKFMELSNSGESMNVNMETANQDEQAKLLLCKEQLEVILETKRKNLKKILDETNFLHQEAQMAFPWQKRFPSN